MARETLLELVREVDSERGALRTIWRDDFDDVLHYFMSEMPEQVYSDNIRKGSMVCAIELIERINSQGYFGPDTILQYANFEAYLRNTDFSSRTATKEDMRQAKQLLELFIDYSVELAR